MTATPVAVTTTSQMLSNEYASIYQTDHIATLNSSQMPDDLPLPVAAANGVLLPATGRASDLNQYDPWTWAQPMKILDHSIPQSDVYGSPSAPGKSGQIVAEWGGMPYPVRDYQDQDQAVALLRRQVKNVQGPAGTYYGGQQTAWEASYATPTPDYWSTLILGSTE